MTLPLLDPGPSSKPWELRLGDCIQGMAALADKSVDHVIVDPPYSEHVHGNAMTTASGLGGVDVDLGFAFLSDAARLALARLYSRLVRRWVLVFSDVESAHLWKHDLESVGLEYIRTCFWRRTNAMPQLSGDRPSAFCEAITLCHPPGRKKWNGGGKAGDYPFPTVQGVGRVHPTQKPEALMRALVQDFTNKGDLILDSHTGSGTTGVACLELGRRFIGFELNPEHHATAITRLENAQRQESLFSAVVREQLPLGVRP